jgi:hypothetical protein
MSRYIVSPHAQGTDEWKLDRLGKATGSAIAAIFATVKTGEAAARADYRMDLVLERITGNVQGIDFTTKDMEWGTAQEPYSRMAYEMATELMVQESGFVYLPNVAAGCSVDGFIHDNGRFGIWESKSPKSKTHLSYLMGKKLPSLYVPQVEHNLWITGATFCDFVSFDPRMPEPLQLFITRYERDEARIRAHEAAVMQFLMEVKRDEKSMLDLIAQRQAELEVTTPF